MRVPIAGITEGERALPDEAARYLIRVHRLGRGDAFVAFDPEHAVEADAELVLVGRREAAARFGSVRPALVRPARPVTLVQSLGKGDTFDQVVRDATELGATRVVPAIASRSVVRLGSKDLAQRTARYRRIAIEAARQCGRGDAPAIESVHRIDEALASFTTTTSAFCLDPESSAPLGPALSEAPIDRGLFFLVGPEGGLTPEELAAAEQHGAQRVSLGPLVLRTETVCAAVLGAALVLDQARRR